MWLDKYRLQGGLSWTLEIEHAIDRSQIILPLLTQGSYISHICRCEQLRSLRKGKCVIPLLAASESDIPLHLEAIHYRDFTETRAYTSNLRSLLSDIKAKNGVQLRETFRTTPIHYVTVPPMVPNYVERPAALHALRNALFQEDKSSAVALTALKGMGGIGKTVLVQALFKDEAVQEAFPDGLVWITVGREPTFDFTEKLSEIAELLGGLDSKSASVETRYRTTIKEKSALIILDDIWSKAHLDVADYLLGRNTLVLISFLKKRLPVLLGLGCGRCVLRFTLLVHRCSACWVVTLIFSQTLR